MARWAGSSWYIDYREYIVKWNPAFIITFPLLLAMLNLAWQLAQIFSWSQLCCCFNNIANIPLPGIFTQDVLTRIWQYNVRSRFNHIYSNPEHMSVFISCDILPVNSVPPPWGTNTWHDVVPDMVFSPWNMISCPGLRGSTVSFSTYKNMLTANFVLGTIIVIKFKWSHDMSFKCYFQRKGGNQLLHSTTTGITQIFSIWRCK